MTTFIGEYNCRIDAKSRVVLPSSFKKQLDAGAQENFVVKKDIFENCLVLYPKDEWMREIEMIRAKTNSYKREDNKFIRGLFKDMAELTLDSMNRLLIPRKLVNMVSIEKEVVMLGRDDRIEIWSSESFNKVNENVGEDDFAALAEKIMGGNSNNDNKED